MHILADLVWLLFCAMIGGGFATVCGAIVLALLGGRRGGGGFLIVIAIAGAFAGAWLGAGL